MQVHDRHVVFPVTAAIGEPFAFWVLYQDGGAFGDAVHAAGKRRPSNKKVTREPTRMPDCAVRSPRLISLFVCSASAPATCGGFGARSAESPPQASGKRAPRRLGYSWQRRESCSLTSSRDPAPREKTLHCHHAPYGQSQKLPSSIGPGGSVKVPVLDHIEPPDPGAN